MSEEHKELVGIDGWLVFYLFSLFLFLFGLLSCAYNAVEEELHAIFIFFPLLLFVLDIILLFLLWKKKRTFRTLAIVFQSLIIFDAIMSITYYVLSSESYQIGSICIQLFLGIIWLIYVIKSKRIEYTCVN